MPVRRGPEAAVAPGQSRGGSGPSGSEWVRSRAEARRTGSTSPAGRSPRGDATPPRDARVDRVNTKKIAAAIRTTSSTAPTMRPAPTPSEGADCECWATTSATAAMPVRYPVRAARSRGASLRGRLPEREHVRLGARLEERDLDRPLAHRVVLAHELVEAAVPEHAVAVLVD